MTNIETKPTSSNQPFSGTRRGDGGTYLIIADDSPEFENAAYYAARLCIARRASLCIAHITELEEFIHWGKVETLMRHDLRKQAEKDLWTIAKDINETHGIYPSLHIYEGERTEKILEIIAAEKNIRALILGGSTQGKNPGPLITHFSGKGMPQLKIPMIIVPESMDQLGIDAVT